VSWANHQPVVTAVVRCCPVVRGPDVAPMWPRRSPAWKAVRSRRPGLILRRWRGSDPPAIDRC
jgi:hypothetical protein